MISTKFVHSLMKVHDITQKDISEQWSKFSGKKKMQSQVSRTLTYDYVDSLSFIKSLSKLTGISIGDLSYEIAPLNDTLVFNSVSEPKSDYIHEDAQVDIPVSNISSMAGGLLGAVNEVTVPRAWVKYGSHKITPVYDEGMTPSILPGDLIVYRLVDNGDWDNLNPDSIYQFINKEGNHLIKRVDQIVDDEHFHLSCENPNKALYPNYTIDRENIYQVWEAEFKLTWKFPRTGDQIADSQSVSEILKKLAYEMKEIKKKVPK